MQILPLPIVLVATLLVAQGCSRSTEKPVAGRRLPTWEPDATSLPSFCSYGLEQRSNSEMHFTVENRSREPVVVNAYYFGYVIEVHYADGERSLHDYGADKVPAPSVHDWHVLRPGMALGWVVALPVASRGFDRASSVTYRESGLPIRVSSTIAREFPTAQRLHIAASWSRSDN